METKHTIGPWAVNPPPTCKAVIPRTVHHLQHEEPLSYANQICIMIDASFSSDANAQLIASAPDLLAGNAKLRGALDQAVDALEHCLARLDHKALTCKNSAWKVSDQVAFDKATAAMEAAEKARG